MKTLSEYSKDFFKLKTSKNPNDMELFEKSLIKFCKTGKKEDAFSVFFCYCEIFKMFGRGYQTIDKLLELLSDHEFHAGELLLSIETIIRIRFMFLLWGLPYTLMVEYLKMLLKNTMV